MSKTWDICRTSADPPHPPQNLGHLIWHFSELRIFYEEQISWLGHLTHLIRPPSPLFGKCPKFCSLFYFESFPIVTETIFKDYLIVTVTFFQGWGMIRYGFFIMKSQVKILRRSQLRKQVESVRSGKIICIMLGQLASDIFQHKQNTFFNWLIKKTYLTLSLAC